MRDVSPRPHQLCIEVEQVGIDAARQLRGLERLHGLRVGDLLPERGERGELGAAAVTRGLRDLRVDVVREELKRRGLAVLLAHEQHRREWREQRAQRGQRLHVPGQAIAEGTVSDLIVVLGEDDEALGRHVIRRGAKTAAAIRRVGAVVHVRPTQRLGQIAHLPELDVVPIALVGDQRAQGVVEVVCPSAVAAVSAAPRRPHHLGVVEAGLGDHERVGPRLVHAPGDRGHDVLRARVEDRVDRVEPQAVDAEVLDPAGGALDDPLAHRIAVGVVVVDRATPRCLILVGEVGPERLERRDARGADVVVDDVEDHGQAGVVGRRDELGKSYRPSVRGLSGRDVDPVISPAASTRELGHRHDLDCRDAEIGQAFEIRDRPLEGPLGAERPDV